MKYAWQMMNNSFKTTNSSIVYYHDKSLDNAPSSWTNKYFKPKLEVDTQHFKFYSVEKR